MTYRFVTLLILLSSLFFHTACSQNSQTTPQYDTIPLETKIGQMLMVGFHGFSVSDTSHIIRDITEYKTGGVILFDYHVPERSPNRNIESPSQTTQLIHDLQALSEVPLFMAVDQEGGRVARLKTDRDFPQHRSAAYLGKLNNPDSTRYFARSMAKSLHELGFNVNFAPVVDLNTNPQNPVIGMLDRSFGPDTDTVTMQASIFLNEFTKQGILGVLKHFPGHGSAWNDSHVGMADVTDTWDPVELEPYRMLAEGNDPFAVMTAHVLNQNLDSEWPATLSAVIQNGILREEIGFQGVLFSDDMQMDAIRSFYGLETSVERAIAAGVDVLVFANNSVYDPEIVPTVTAIIKDLVNSGTISEERIDLSYRRIIAEKNRLLSGKLE